MAGKKKPQHIVDSATEFVKALLTGKSHEHITTEHIKGIVDKGFELAEAFHEHAEGKE